MRSPHGSVGYAVVVDVELVAAARPADRTDLADYLPEDLEIEIASGVQLLLDFDGEAKVAKVSYNGLHSVDGKALVGEISYRRFPSLIKGRGRLYVEPRGCVIIYR